MTKKYWIVWSPGYQTLDDNAGEGFPTFELASNAALSQKNRFSESSARRIHILECIGEVVPNTGFKVSPVLEEKS